MASRKRRSTTIKEGLSKEGRSMDAIFKKATDRARRNAFKVRKTIMVERNGWLVMVNKDGKVTRKVKKLVTV